MRLSVTNIVSSEILSATRLQRHVLPQFARQWRQTLVPHCGDRTQLTDFALPDLCSRQMKSLQRRRGIAASPIGNLFTHENSTSSIVPQEARGPQILKNVAALAPWLHA